MLEVYTSPADSFEEKNYLPLPPPPPKKKKKTIVPLTDISMLYIKYLTMYKVHMHAGAIRKLVYGCTCVREIIHSLKLVDYLPVQSTNQTITYTCSLSTETANCFKIRFRHTMTKLVVLFLVFIYYIITINQYERKMKIQILFDLIRYPGSGVVLDCIDS